MIPEPLKEQERRLRKAIERRQYREVPRLMEDLRRTADQNPGPEVSARMLATIRWARLMVTTQRQMWADELELLPAVNRYLERLPDPPPGLCLDL